MSLDLLDAPLRLTWDVGTAECALPPGRLERIADEITAAGVFYLTLLGRPLTLPNLDALVALLLDGACQVRLVTTGTVAETAGLDRLAGRPVRLLLDATPWVDERGGFDEPGLTAALAAARRVDPDTMLALTPLRSTLAAVPALLEFCAAQAVAGFKLPNAHIGASVPAYSAEDLPRGDDLERFERLWREPKPILAGRPALEIHDRFLWEIMTPGDEQARGEYGGCQAANSLGHVDRQGRVHPCAAWPEPLGSLLEASLEEIWESPRRLAIRQELTRLPAGCAGCTVIADCLGGCRGLGRTLNRGAGDRDLMCSGPR